MDEIDYSIRVLLERQPDTVRQSSGRNSTISPVQTMELAQIEEQRRARDKLTKWFTINRRQMNQIYIQFKKLEAQSGRTSRTSRSDIVKNVPFEEEITVEHIYAHDGNWDSMYKLPPLSPISSGFLAHSTCLMNKSPLIFFGS